MANKKTLIDGQEFDAYLSEIIGVNLADFPKLGEWSGAGDTFGAIALKLNLISMDVIDSILEAQHRERLRFGELAVKMGLLTQDQADSIIEIQRFHRSLETGERLVVTGKLSLPELLRILADFLAEKSKQDKADS